jgi:RimJ/RimL family protein N-acetyltransferase
MSVRIRHGEPGDASALVELAHAVGAEEGGWLVTSGTWRTPWEERRYLRALRRYPDAAVLVAEEDGHVVGRLSIVRDAHPACAHVADVGIMVQLDRRRSGIGSALMRAAEDWARRAGISKLELHVFPHNEAALGLYRSLGYVQEGYRRRHFRRDEEYVDAVLMAKEV